MNNQRLLRCWLVFRFIRTAVIVCASAVLIYGCSCGGGGGEGGEGGGGDDFLADPVADSLDELTEASETGVEFRFENGVPEVVSLKIPVPSDLEDDEVVHALDFLEKYKEFYRLSDPEDQLFLNRVKLNEEDDEQHLFFTQKHNGIPIFGAELAVHIIGGFYRITNGRYLPDFLPSLSGPTIDEDEAEEAAIDGAPGTDVEAVGVARLMYFDLSLLDPNEEEDTHLAWRISLQGLSNVDGTGTAWIAFVDAHSGEALFYVNESPSFHPADKDFDIQTANNNNNNPSLCFPFTDTDDWFDEGGEDGYPGAGSDAFLDGQDASDFAHIVYNYFDNTFDRHSWDNEDEQVEIYVHAGPTLPNATWFNANFRGSCMAFGEGLVQLDVFAHEWGHGIDYNEGDLIYAFESGALDESFADFWGAMVDNDDWTIGEDIPASILPFDDDNDGLLNDRFVPLRDMSDPTLFGQPDTMNNYAYLAKDIDNGGVHTNSGIPNKVAYLLVEGGTHNGYIIGGMGQSKAEQFYYDILVNYISGGSGFSAACFLSTTIAQIYALSAPPQHDFTQNDVCDVKNAWAAVGILPGNADSDCDGTADSLDPDDDGDSTPDGDDNCPGISNPGQSDLDGDGKGDACDSDIDEDEVNNSGDNCPYTSNSDQEDSDGDGKGDVCDDNDGDGYLNADDNCPNDSNYDQADNDGDGTGDVCDDDDDNDGDKDSVDNCPDNANEDQADGDGDEVGDVCDNCSSDSNEDQKDCDNNGTGAVCDPDELPLPGDCGELGDLLILRLVKPLELIALLKDCEVCGNWLPPNAVITVNVAIPVGAGPAPERLVRILDDKGHLVKQILSTESETLSFTPKAGFHFKVPGSERDAFQGVEYFLEFSSPGDGSLDSFEANLSVEFSTP